MLKKYLLTTQPPSCTRTRCIVKADSSFQALEKAWAQVEAGNAPYNAPYDVDTYVSVRPATKEDIEKYGEWVI